MTASRTPCGGTHDRSPASGHDAPARRHDSPTTRPRYDASRCRLRETSPARCRPGFEKLDLRLNSRLEAKGEQVKNDRCGSIQLFATGVSVPGHVPARVRLPVQPADEGHGRGPRPRGRGLRHTARVRRLEQHLDPVRGEGERAAAAPRGRQRLVRAADVAVHHVRHSERQLRRAGAWDASGQCDSPRSPRSRRATSCRTSSSSSATGRSSGRRATSRIIRSSRGGSSSPSIHCCSARRIPTSTSSTAASSSALAAALPDSVRPSKVFVYRLLFGGQPRNPNGPQFRLHRRSVVAARTGLRAAARAHRLLHRSVAALVRARDAAQPEQRAARRRVHRAHQRARHDDRQHRRHARPRVRGRPRSVREPDLGSARHAGRSRVPARDPLGLPHRWQRRSARDGADCASSPAEAPSRRSPRPAARTRTSSSSASRRPRTTRGSTPTTGCGRGLTIRTASSRRAAGSRTSSATTSSSSRRCSRSREPGSPDRSQNPANDTIYRTPGEYLYSTRHPQSFYRLRVSYESQVGDEVGTLALNAVQLRPGSERITIDGRQLVRGVDYEIDYELGRVTFTQSGHAVPVRAARARAVRGESAVRDRSRRRSSGSPRSSPASTARSTSRRSRNRSARRSRARRSASSRRRRSSPA